MMLELLKIAHAHDREQPLHFLGDSAFTSSSMLSRMPVEIAVTGRIGSNSRIHSPAPERTEGRGRPRVRGERLDTPDEMLDAKGLRRVELKLYDNTEYKVRLAEQTGFLFKAPKRAVKVVAIEHQRGGRGREVFYSTEVTAEATMILLWFSWRWPIEVTFLDSKQHLGLGEAENRKTKAVRRTVPTGLLMYSLIVLWHECIRKKPAPSLRKWTGKEHASFAEMVAALRTDSLDDFQRKHLSTPGIPRAVHKNTQTTEIPDRTRGITAKDELSRPIINQRNKSGTMKSGEDLQQKSAFRAKAKPRRDPTHWPGQLSQRKQSPTTSVLSIATRLIAGANIFADGFTEP